MNLGTLEGGLKPYGFSGLPVGGAKLRERTSGVVTPTFLAPTVSIKMATKHAGMKGYEKTRMQITKIRKIKAVTCSHYNKGSTIQDRAASFAAGHPRGRRIYIARLLQEDVAQYTCRTCCR
jgi:hypothetical protein